MTGQALAYLSLCVMLALVVSHLAKRVSTPTHTERELVNSFCPVF